MAKRKDLRQPLFSGDELDDHRQMQGWLLGNVKNNGLQKLLQESNYLKNVCTTVKDLKEHNERCAKCRWFKYCCGGCRAVGLALTEDVFGSDLSKYLFFNGGYMKKLQETLAGYHNTSPIR